jgi:hypothetical protein
MLKKVVVGAWLISGVFAVGAVLAQATGKDTSKEAPKEVTKEATKEATKDVGKDLSVKLYSETPPVPAAKAPVKAAEAEPGDTNIVRCVDKGRVTFTNGKCETGQAQATAVRRSAPAENQITRSAAGQPPKPLAALPPLYETVQATSGTAGYELREQCAKLDSQLARLDAQAALALPKPEPETNRKRREDIERKKFSLRCG